MEETIQRHKSNLLTASSLPLQDRVSLVLEALLHQGTPEVLQLVGRNLELSGRLLRPVTVKSQALSLLTLSQDQTPMIQESTERAVTDAQKRSREKWLPFQPYSRRRNRRSSKSQRTQQSAAIQQQVRCANTRVCVYV